MTTTTKRSPDDEGRDAAVVATVIAGVLGVLLSLGALSIYGSRTGFSVAVGAMIAVANLLTMRAIIRSIIQEPEPEPEDGKDPKDDAPAPAPDHVAEGKRGGAAWGAFALLKILVLFGGIWILLTRGMVDPIPLVVGYGVLPLGIAASSLFQSLKPRRRR